jgi:hypothetical protein
MRAGGARRNRLTDPAFAGSAAFADYGAPELFSDAFPSMRAAT